MCISNTVLEKLKTNIHLQSGKLCKRADVSRHCSAELRNIENLPKNKQYWLHIPIDSCLRQCNTLTNRLLIFPKRNLLSKITSIKSWLPSKLNLLKRKTWVLYALHEYYVMLSKTKAWLARAKEEALSVTQVTHPEYTVLC